MNSQKSPDKEKLRSLLVKCIIIFIVLLAGQLIFKIVIVPGIVLKKVRVGGDLSLSDSEIRTIAGIEKGQYYYNLHPGDIKDKLENYPEVRTASVEKIFPDKLQLYIFARKAVAQSVLKINEKSIPVAIDREGVVFSSGRDMEDWDLPVITGVHFESLELGARLPEALHPLLENLDELKKSEPALFDLLSEVRVERRGDRGYDLILFLNNYPVQARIDNELDGNVLTKIVMVFDVLKKQKLTEKISEVDFRTKEIIYRLREEV